MRHLPPCRTSLLLALVAALVALVAPGAVAAHAPTLGASRGSYPDLPDQVVPWRFGSNGYPSWLTAAVVAGLANYPVANNSAGPRPVPAASGTSTASYTAATVSPCSSLQNYQWLQCASNGGTWSFRIHVRDFERAPYSDWRWWDTGGGCATATGRIASGCWLIARTLIHEAGHAIATFGHDLQGESETVMGPKSPEVDQAGGTRRTLRRCDVAALQLLWGLASPTGPIADCFDEIPDHGTTGLVTRLTSASIAYRACPGESATASGRLAVATASGYRKLSGIGLAGRAVRFDRKRRADTTWTADAESTIAADRTGSNWSRAFSSPTGGSGTWDYRAHFDGEPGLDPSGGVGFSVTWSASCY